MTRLYNEVEINASPEKVWGVLVNLEEVGKYNPGVTAVRYISEHKTGVGAARHCDLGKDYVKERVSEVLDLKSISMEAYESSWPLKVMRWTTELHPIGSTTWVKQVAEYEPGMGIFGKIMNALVMKRKFRKAIDDVFLGLKKYIEEKK